MLSVLIPIYNFDVRDLVIELKKQLTLAKVKYEIILVDDNSTKYSNLNFQLSDLEHVSYEYLNKNIGRAKIRNYLASKAKYENLLFLDSDSGIDNKKFIENYLQNADSEVIYGGTKYSEKEIEPEKKLHYKYGKKREALITQERQSKPYLSFRTNNFVIKKYIFKQVFFDERIKKYGHEDTLFAYELAQKGIKIKHIENPVEHLGLENNTRFIEKVKESVESLNELAKEPKIKQERFFAEIRLLKYFFNLKKYYLCWLVNLCYKLFNKPIEKNLKSYKPKLFFLDLFKLMYICSIQKKNKKRKIKKEFCKKNTNGR
jgi:glycosyltransferase involved in cell wall biosynthesis